KNWTGITTAAAIRIKMIITTRMKAQQGRPQHRRLRFPSARSESLVGTASCEVLRVRLKLRGRGQDWTWSRMLSRKLRRLLVVVSCAGGGGAGSMSERPGGCCSNA